MSASRYGISFKNRTGTQYVADVAKVKGDEQRFVLSPMLWSKYPGVSQTLRWETVRFDKSEKKNIPKKRGVYCFAVQPPVKNGPPALFPLYIGETGNRSAGTLNGRFGQYFGEQAKLKRPHVHLYLNKWKASLLFLFAVVAKGNLIKIESMLNGAYVPPFSHEDFDALLRKVVSAWRHT